MLELHVEQKKKERFRNVRWVSGTVERVRQDYWRPELRLDLVGPGDGF